tara:strand:+ start:4049 stop:4750 length:702 start_codon:yes stop_codon:yes gene_type:complete
MKYFIITSPRCGSHYCAESIAQRLQILPLGECLHPMYKNDMYTFENNQVQVHWPKHVDKKSICSTTYEIQNKLDKLLATDNDWQAQAHIAHFEKLDKDAIKNIVEKTNAILLYRENFTDAIISWVIANENDNFVPREQQTMQRVYYDKNKYSEIVEYLIKNYKLLQEIKDKYNWFKVYKYEDFTGDPSLDFSDYTLQNQNTSWNLPIKNNTEEEKKNLIINIQDLIEDINGLE